MSEKADSKKTSKPKSAAKSAPKASVPKTPTKRSTRKAKTADAGKENTVRIEGKDYSLDSLSGQARAQILNLRATDQRIEHLKQELLITQTARQAYAEALADELGASKDQTLQ